MHELSITQALVEQVEAAAKEEKATRVLRVVITVGVLSGVEPEALRSIFPLVAEETVAAGAELVIEPVATRVKCRVCGQESAARDYLIGCSTCDSKDVELIAGRELNIKSIEIEVEER
jgi:hydrogenase nickel incorporation protein HypA/HybF